MENSNTNSTINITEDISREIVNIFASCVLKNLQSCKDRVYYTSKDTSYDVTLCIGIGTDFGIECDDILSKIQYGLTAEAFANIVREKYRKYVIDTAIREAFY